MSHTPVVPTLSPLMQVRLRVDVAPITGPSPGGYRRITAILGGEFAGEQLRGHVLPGGGDWTVRRDDQCSVLDARYVLQTHDGALIYVQEHGLHHGPEHTMARLAKGEPVNPKDYYFRTTPRLETASRDYAWLNRIVVIGSAMRQGQDVVIDYYRAR